MIEVKGLCFAIQDRPILDNITLTIDDGEILGIIGGSGSGKSVLLKILSGQLRGYTGSVAVDGVPLHLYLKGHTHTKVSYFHGHLPANKDDILKNFLFLSRIPYKRMFRDFTDYDRQVVEEYMDLLNLDDSGDSAIGALSDSVLCRSMLAYAFIREAKIIAMDDPTSHLDIRSVMLLHKTVSRYVIHGDRTAIAASNDLNFVLQTADRILILDEGKGACKDIPENITREMIQKFFRTEVLLTRNIYNGRPEIHLFPGN